MPWVAGREAGLAMTVQTLCRLLTQITAEAEQAELEVARAMIRSAERMVRECSERVAIAMCAAERYACDVLRMPSAAATAEDEIALMYASIFCDRALAVVRRFRDAHKAGAFAGYGISGARVDRYDADLAVVRRGPAILPVCRDVHDYGANEFDWGCASAGSRQLALAILCEVHGPEIAREYVGVFHADVVFGLPAMWELPIAFVEAYICAQTKTGAAS